jgi:hypothetical protein
VVAVKPGHPAPPEFAPDVMSLKAVGVLKPVLYKKGFMKPASKQRHVKVSRQATN